LLRERGLAAERGGMVAVVEPTVERWFTPSFLADPAVNGVRERLLRNDPLNWSATWHAIATFDALTELGNIRTPTLVIAGERDAATPLAATAAIADAIPGARRVILPGAPHMMQIECRDAFNSAVGAFLADRRTGAGSGVQGQAG
jgi:3-oxoadipate enol-lactonase